MRLDCILQKMKKAEQKIYAIEKAKLRLEKDLKEVQKKWFHGKEKKELEQKISGKRQELRKAQETLSEIPKMQGYENALEVKKPIMLQLLNWKVFGNFRVNGVRKKSRKRSTG